MKNFALLFTLLIALSGCKMEACKPGQVSCGTGTGNPMTESSQIGAGAGNGVPDTTSPVTSDTSPVATELLLAAICGKVNQCAPQVTVQACRAKIQDLESLHPQLGIELSTIDSFGAAILAERAGTIRADLSAASQCTADIEALSCNDERIEKVLGANGDLDVSSLLTSSCKSIF